MANAPRTLTGPPPKQLDVALLAAFPTPHDITQRSSVHFATAPIAPVCGPFPHRMRNVPRPGPALGSGRRPVAPPRVERPINLTLRIRVM
jgi:hypothetical protein